MQTLLEYRISVKVMCDMTLECVSYLRSMLIFLVYGSVVGFNLFEILTSV